MSPDAGRPTGRPASVLVGAGVVRLRRRGRQADDAQLASPSSPGTWLAVRWGQRPGATRSRVRFQHTVVRGARRAENRLAREAVGDYRDAESTAGRDLTVRLRGRLAIPSGGYVWETAASTTQAPPTGRYRFVTFLNPRSTTPLRTIEEEM